MKKTRACRGFAGRDRGANERRRRAQVAPAPLPYISRADHSSFTVASLTTQVTWVLFFNAAMQVTTALYRSNEPEVFFFFLLFAHSFSLSVVYVLDSIHRGPCRGRWPAEPPKQLLETRFKVQWPGSIVNRFHDQGDMDWDRETQGG